MICPRCDEYYDEEYTFCPNCGLKKSEVMICHECTERYYDYTFCPKCGEKLLTYDESQEKLIELIKEKYKSPNTINFMIEKMKEGMISFFYQIEDQTLLYGFEPKTQLDLKDVINSYVGLDKDLKRELIYEVNQNTITDLEELEERKKNRCSN